MNDVCSATIIIYIVVGSGSLTMLFHLVSVTIMQSFTDTSVYVIETVVT